MQRPRTDEALSTRLDRVFFALADSTRRSLLDRLYSSDGQRLSQLAEDFVMSRQAISKHLEVLDDAGLVSMRREGRETRYFLNRAPLRAAQSLWIEKYTALRVRIDCA
jgi:DNA-binding transcriptional ArsR family regulator